MISQEQIVLLTVSCLGGGGIGGVLISSFLSRKKDRVETSKIQVEGAAVLSDAAMRLVQYLDGELNQVRGKLDAANQNAALMARQLHDANAKHTEIEQKIGDLSAALNAQGETEEKLVVMVRRLINALFKFDPTSPLIVEAKTLIDSLAVQV